MLVLMLVSVVGGWCWWLALVFVVGGWCWWLVLAFVVGVGNTHAGDAGGQREATREAPGGNG
eukprot:7489263-Lingulodinium_polyedra.AAC.1